MEEFLNRLAELILGRVEGPLHFRLLLQPTIAVLLAVKAGREDAIKGKTPYFWSLFAEPGGRARRLQEGWKSVSKVFLLAIALDLVYQYLALPHIRPFGALMVAITLAILPYLLVRGLVTRVMSSSERAPQK